MIHPPEVRRLPLYERGVPSAFRQFLWAAIEEKLVEAIVHVMIEGSGEGRPQGLNEILTKP